MAEDFIHFMNSRAERIIEQAIQDGEFDNLPGSGKPLPEEDYSDIPHELRMAYKVLKNAGYLPPEAADRKEIHCLLELLEQCEDGAEKLRQMQKLDVILMRMKNREHRSIALTDSDPYYRNVVRRISLIKKNTEGKR